MTVLTELSRATFPWTGVETAFACGFPADKIADLKVYFTTAAGVTSQLTLGVHYSASLASSTKIATVLPLALPPAPGTLIVDRGTPALVPESLADGQEFSLRVIQQMFDRLAMAAAETRTRLSRAIVLDEGAELGSGNFDLGGSGLSNIAPGTQPNDAATVQQLLDLVIASGNVPTPLGADVSRVIQALAPGLFGWGPIIHTAATALLAAGSVHDQRVALGGTVPGEALWTAASAAAQRIALQITALGEQILLAPDTGTALSSLGISAFVQSLLDDPNATAVLATLGITDRLIRPGSWGAFWRSTAPSGWLKANAAAVDRHVYSELDAEIYCGDANNPTAAWGYRCTNPASPSSSRNIAGGYIVLPDGRGEFFRGWDDGRGVDSGRSLWSAQGATRIPALSVDGSGALLMPKNSPIAEHDGSIGAAVTRTIFNGTDNSTITPFYQARVRNLSPLICIKY